MMEIVSNTNINNDFMLAPISNNYNILKKGVRTVMTSLGIMFTVVEEIFNKLRLEFK